MNSLANDIRTPIGTTTVLLIIFLVFLPKGGIAVAGIPITWGYLLIGGACFYLLLQTLLLGSLRLLRLLCWFATLPFLSVFFLTILFIGVKPGATGFAISFVVTFGVLPLFFYIAADHYLTQGRVQQIGRIVANGLFWVAIYGIVLFIVGFATGKLWDLPMITSTAFENTSLAAKDNLRGDIFKLVSTYANGNIYGACMAMMIPYSSKILSRWKSNILKISLLLTLSRTAWVALILIQLYAAASNKRQHRLTWKILLAIGMSVLAIAAGLYILGDSSGFLFDPTLGGRIGTFESVAHAQILAMHPFAGIAEAVYPSLIYWLGWGGLITFLISVCTPIFLAIANGAFRDPFRKDLLAGLCIYLVVAMSDGAILLIPVMAIFWAMASMVLEPRQAEKNMVLPEVRG